jgi:hypothetical protein
MGVVAGNAHSTQKTRPEPGFPRDHSRRAELALTGLHPRVLLVDDVDPAMATHDAAILVASFRGLQGVTDLHHKLSGKMLDRWRDMPGEHGNVNLRELDFSVIKRSFAFTAIPLLNTYPAATAVDSPRSREL